MILKVCLVFASDHGDEDLEAILATAEVIFPLVALSSSRAIRSLDGSFAAALAMCARCNALKAAKWIQNARRNTCENAIHNAYTEEFGLYQFSLCF